MDSRTPSSAFLTLILVSWGLGGPANALAGSGLEAWMKQLENPGTRQQAGRKLVRAARLSSGEKDSALAIIRLLRQFASSKGSRPELQSWVSGLIKEIAAESKNPAVATEARTALDGLRPKETLSRITDNSSQEARSQESPPTSSPQSSLKAEPPSQEITSSSAGSARISLPAAPTAPVFSPAGRATLAKTKPKESLQDSGGAAQKKSGPGTPASEEPDPDPDSDPDPNPEPRVPTPSLGGGSFTPSGRGQSPRFEIPGSRPALSGRTGGGGSSGASGGGGGRGSASGGGGSSGGSGTAGPTGPSAPSKPKGPSPEELRHARLMNALRGPDLNAAMAASQQLRSEKKQPNCGPPEASDPEHKGFNLVEPKQAMRDPKTGKMQPGGNRSMTHVPPFDQQAGYCYACAAAGLASAANQMTWAGKMKNFFRTAGSKHDSVYSDLDVAKRSDGLNGGTVPDAMMAISNIGACDARAGSGSSSPMSFAAMAGPPSGTRAAGRFDWSRVRGHSDPEQTCTLSASSHSFGGVADLSKSVSQVVHHRGRGAWVAAGPEGATGQESNETSSCDNGFIGPPSAKPQMFDDSFPTPPTGSQAAAVIDRINAMLDPDLEKQTAVLPIAISLHASIFSKADLEKHKAVPPGGGSGNDGHAVLIVGKAMIGGKCNFLIHNSWGQDWHGDKVSNAKLERGRMYVPADLVMSGLIGMHGYRNPAAENAKPPGYEGN